MPEPTTKSYVVREVNSEWMIIEVKVREGDFLYGTVVFTNHPDISIDDEVLINTKTSPVAPLSESFVNKVLSGDNE